LSNSTTPRFGRRASVVAADSLVVVALTALVCVPVWPGVFNADAQFMLLGARADAISSQYAPLLGWAWSLLDGAGVPAGMVFLLGVVAFVSAVLVLVRQFLQPFAARVVTAGIVLFPPVYGLLGLVGRDVWFATAALLITAVAWRVLQRPDAPSSGTAVGLVVLGLVAADSRQNGAPFAALAIGLVAYRLIGRLRPQAAPLTRIAATTLSLALFFGGVLSAQRLVVRTRYYPEQILHIVDLVGVSLERNEPELPRDLFPAQDMNLLRTMVGPLDFRSLLYAQPQVVKQRNRSGEVNAVWTRQWRRVLREHPIDYLIWRGRLYIAQLGITHGVREPYLSGSSEIIDNRLRGSVENVFPGLLEARNEVLSAIDGPEATGSFVVVPAWYLLITAISIVYLGRNGQQRAVVALLVTVSAMQGLLFFTAPGFEYRLEYFQVVLGTTFGSIVVVRRLQTVAVRSRQSQARPAVTTTADHVSSGFIPSGTD
jgi:hypothetical protein